MRVVTDLCKGCRFPRRIDYLAASMQRTSFVRFLVLLLEPLVAYLNLFSTKSPPPWHAFIRRLDYVDAYLKMAYVLATKWRYWQCRCLEAAGITRSEFSDEVSEKEETFFLGHTVRWGAFGGYFSANFFPPIQL